MPDISAARAAIPLPSAELNLGSTSTSEKQFITASAQNGVAAGQPLTLYIPGSLVLNRRPFRVRVGGRVSAVGNFTGQLDYGTSSTIASNTTIATTGALAAGSTGGGTWELWTDLCWDSTSSNLQGTQGGRVYNTVVAFAILTATANTNLATEGLGFTVTGTFATGSAANYAYVDWFECLTE